MIANNNRPRIINYQPPYSCHEQEYQPPIQNIQNQLHCREAAFQSQSKPNRSPNHVNDVININSIATVGSPGIHKRSNPKLRFQKVWDRSSTGTTDTIPLTPETPPISNGFSLGRIGGDDNKIAENNHFKFIQQTCNEQFKVNHAMLHQLTLTQDFLREKGKKGFRFAGDPKHYESLVTVYSEKTILENLTA